MQRSRFLTLNSSTRRVPPLASSFHLLVGFLGSRVTSRAARRSQSARADRRRAICSKLVFTLSPPQGMLGVVSAEIAP